MSYWQLAASFGLGAVQAFGHSNMERAKARAAKTQWKINRKTQEMTNKLHALGVGRQLNVNTQNEIRAQQDTVEAAAQIQRSKLTAESDAIVNAAAAGVNGNSIKAQLRQINTDAALVQAERYRQFSRENQAIALQRQDIQWEGIVGKDRTIFMKPNTAGTDLGSSIFKTVLGGFTSAYGTYQAGVGASS